MSAYAAIGVMLAALVPAAAAAQEVPPHYGAAWRPIMSHEGVDFYYIFYTEADNRNDGVVILLANRNEYAVEYRFQVVFRSADREVTRDVAGTLHAGEAKTGDHDGLFWIPFDDGTSIVEIGLRGYAIVPVEWMRQRILPAGQSL